jgi:hypothetical protein
MFERVKQTTLLISFFVLLLIIALKLDKTVESKDINTLMDKPIETDFDEEINLEKFSANYYITQYNTEKCALVAAIPEDNIFLYSINKKGALLTYNDHHKYYNWTLDPFMFPSLSLLDIDHDNKKELIVINTIGHGTGALEQELHIIELADADAIDEYLGKQTFDSESLKKNDLYLKDYCIKFYDDNSFKPIIDTFQYKYRRKGKKLFLDISVNQKITTIKAAKKEKDLAGIIPGMVAIYRVNDDKLSVELGVMFGFLEYVGHLKADVHFKNGVFSFDNINFVP